MSITLNFSLPPIESLIPTTPNFSTQSNIFSTNHRFGSDRPQIIRDMIDRHFQRVSMNKSQSGYSTIGDRNYKFQWDNEKIISSAQIIKHFVDYSPERPLKVLDIGTGNGLWLEQISSIYKEKVAAFGLTATDSRAPDSKVPNEHYIIGNAEKLIEDGLFEKCPPSGIISAFTFMHLTDPLATLCEAYERLQPRGILCIDSLPVPGLNGYVHHLIDFLNNEGYQIAASFSELDNREGNITSLLIQKTHPHLNLPVKYDLESLEQDQETCLYQIDNLCIPKIPVENLKFKPKSISPMVTFEWGPEKFNFTLKFPPICEGFIKIFKEKIIN